ncbi:MAG: hypothetical protein FJZ05_00835 [Candidatus Nealsonbacteria bacterium]|nr:hypothetical protein [Candidatus Nealsonbacteria bacterium]
MELTDRQTRILNNIIKNYVRSVEPVSSEFLEKKYDFGVCSATIRNEMQKLTDEGFLSQPHTSAGRVPTDKGYRFFVDSLLKEHSLKNIVLEDWFDGEINNTVKFLQSVTKNLALVSSSLSLGYLQDKEILWKEGWEEIIKEPEFRERKLIDDFISMVKSFEEEIANFDLDADIKVYIGKENPLPKAREFSAIVTKCHFPKNEQGLLAIFGPKRMDYDKSICSLNSLIRLLDKV